MAAMSLLAAPPMRFDEQESKFNFQSAEEVIQVKYHSCSATMKRSYDAKNISLQITLQFAKKSDAL